MNTSQRLKVEQSTISIMSECLSVIKEAKALLDDSNPEGALDFISLHAEEHRENPAFLETFGEILLENNLLEEAYDILRAACDLDPEAAIGTEKFFYLGQIVGGTDGIKLLDIGLRKLSSQLQDVQDDKGQDDATLVELARTYPSKEDLVRVLIKKINKGVFAAIEIWMTDLCMEPDAEEKCDSLVKYALSLDDKNPEALSILSSVRISQQKFDEAKQALADSWEQFQLKKAKLQEAANAGEPNVTKQTELDETSLEYMDLIQPLLSLARYAIELEVYETAIDISAAVQDINDFILESFYYQALSSILLAKRQIRNTNNIAIEDYRDLEIDTLINSSDPQIKTCLEEAKSALTQGYKIINSDSIDADAELIDQVLSTLKSLGGPNKEDLLPFKKDDLDEEGWEDEITYDDEEQ
ncbi:Piso0_005722 [Millerozyma farinosa CBS 7064]|uniref:Piso0_005722 protein n=1 Tax=Pichia sorbitophila (strain ATCC MYA-4447 / BCRC 22081 / CBS 7064 / NBRC 10061 / NRRL Y-12695) TaxID=559304 RepID=G8Y2R2_PICSO|nr:Piso0_005722 [Millerozyma farinosa CBS 7064]